MKGTASEEFTNSLLSISGTGVIVDTVKKAEERGTLIVRLHEMEGATTSCRINMDVRKWREVNLMEDEYLSEYTSGPIDLTFHPYEIKTIELEK